jgi:hypothetical protein
MCPSHMWHSLQIRTWRQNFWKLWCLQYSVSATISLINRFGVKPKFNPIWRWRDTLFTICPLFEFITTRERVSEIAYIFGFRRVGYERTPTLLPTELFSIYVSAYLSVSISRNEVIHHYSWIRKHGVNAEWTDHAQFWEAGHCHREVSIEIMIGAGYRQIKR